MSNSRPSSTARASAKSPLFKYTSPSCKQQRGRGSQALHFITQESSHYSLDDPAAFLRSSPRRVISAHISNDIEKISKAISEIESSQEYASIAGLKQQRETVKAEMAETKSRLDAISSDSASVSAILSERAVNFQSSVPRLQFQQASQLEEEAENLRKLHSSQYDALQCREKRILGLDPDKALEDVLKVETEKNKMRASEIKDRMNEQKKSDNTKICELEAMREKLLRTLGEEYDYYEKDKSVPLSELIDYVKKNDPVIALKMFERRRKESQQLNKPALPENSEIGPLEAQLKRGLERSDV